MLAGKYLPTFWISIWNQFEYTIFEPISHQYSISILPKMSEKHRTFSRGIEMEMGREIGWPNVLSLQMKLSL